MLAYRAVKTPRGEYVEARGKWKKAVMLVRLTFDQDGAVTGFWLARDQEGPTPKGFRRGGYVVGEPMLKLAGYVNLKHTNFESLALHVKLTAPGGGPLSKPPPQISIWKQTTDPAAHSSSAGALVTLFDGTRWQWVRASTRAGQSQCTFERLSPGNYRVVAGASARFDCISDPVRVVDPGKTTAFTGEYVAPVFRKLAITLQVDRFEDRRAGRKVRTTRSILLRAIVAEQRLNTVLQHGQNRRRLAIRHIPAHRSSDNGHLRHMVLSAER